jgi:hypothetical protein
MKLNKTINNEIMTTEQAKESRELIRQMITLEIKGKAQVSKLFDLFKPAIHSHKVLQFMAYQDAFANAAGFKNVATMSKQEGCARLAVTISEFKKYCKEFAGQPESYSEMIEEVKAARDATKTQKKPAKSAPSTGGGEGEGDSSESGAPSGLVCPELIELFNKLAAATPEGQARVAKLFNNALQAEAQKLADNIK